jgi:predicted O-linked N-acetylglucosamine transferase (SPINDLY family)
VPPCCKNGYVTLASFNNFAKVSPTILKYWRNILTRIPDSRLLLKSEVFSDPEARNWILERLAIPVERLLLIGKTPDRTAHLALYGQVDIALDTFPYNGTTTTCEALYMGVPVISLAGQGHASRVGASLLNTVGLRELLADTGDDYVNAAVDLATDVPRLTRLRQHLRQQMAASPLMDQQRFVTALEAEYRLMWQRRIGGGPTPGR